MPTSSIQEQLNHKGHDPNGRQDQAVAHPPLSSPQPQPDPSLQSQQNVHSDWSLMTQELIDTLPRPWTRGLLHVLLGFLVIGLPWAMLAKVDEVGSARGRLEPQGRAVWLDAPVNGTIVNVNVKEGQTVKAGQVLLELDSELTKTELQRTQEALNGLRERLTQLQLMQNQLRIAVAEQQSQNQAQQSAQLAQIDQTQEQLAAAIQEANLAKVRFEREQREVERFQRAYNEGIIAEVRIVDARRLEDESRKQLNQAQAQIVQAQAEIKKQQSTYEDIQQAGALAILQSQRQLDELQTNIVDTRAEIEQNQKQLESLKIQLEQRIIRTPTDGTVFQLEVQHSGSVVQASQEIVQIAPRGVPLVFRAQMPSQETGFLSVNAPVKLKFDAYPFQDYGVIPGYVRWIAPNSKMIETPQGNVEVFDVEISLNQNAIQGNEGKVLLNAGQTATAEVVVRQRRVIDFILDPFKKLQKGGIEL